MSMPEIPVSPNDRQARGSVREREDELAMSPKDLIINRTWVFTQTGIPSGLEVPEAELILPNGEITQ